MQSGPEGTDRPNDDAEEDTRPYAPLLGPQAPQPEPEDGPQRPPLPGPDTPPLPGPQAPQPPPVGPPPPASWSDPAQGRQAPPGGPQAPAAGGASGDSPSAPSSGGPYGGSPSAPPSGPQAPSGPPYAAPPEAPGYGGPVPPGGWQAPLAPAPGWGGAPLASWGSRVGAALLDGLILLVPVVVLTAIVAAIVAAGSNVGAVIVAVIAFLVYFVVALFYAPLLMSREGARNGQTWGKQIVGITVVRNGGEQVGMGFAFLRELVVKQILFVWGGSVLFYIPTLLDYLWPLWDDENRCLHDMIVSTHVVRR